VAEPVITPGNTNTLNLEEWAGTVEGATYQREEFLNTVQVFPGPIFGEGNVRKYKRMEGSTLAQNANGNNLTPVDPIGVPITITPVGRFVKCAWSANQDAQVDVNLRGDLPGEMEQSMAELHDSAALATVATLSQSTEQAVVDAPLWRTVVAALMGNTNGLAAPGESEMIRGIFSNTAYRGLLNIEEFTHADVRGDSENPLVKGIFTKGGGINVRFSTVVYNDGDAWFNCVYLKSAFIKGVNQNTMLVEDRDDLQRKIMLYSNWGISVLHDLRAIAVKTTENGASLS